MIITGISDIHLLTAAPSGRKDDILSEQFKKMEFVLSTTKELGSKYLIVSGDLCDAPRSWKLLSYLIKRLKHYDIKILGVFGQHDMYMRSKKGRTNTTLGILALSEKAVILNDIPFTIDGVDFYGASFEDEVPQIKESDNAILVIHKSISDKKIFSKDTFTYDAKDFLDECWQFKGIFCGDIHRQFLEYDELGRFIVNTGPMLRATLDQYNFVHKPSIAVFDSNKISLIEIPHRPAEEVLDRTKLDFSTSLKKLSDTIKNDIQIDIETFTESVNLHSVLENIYQDYGISNLIKDFINKSMEEAND